MKHLSIKNTGTSILVDFVDKGTSTTIDVEGVAYKLTLVGTDIKMEKV